MFSSLPAIAMLTWQNFAYQLVESTGMTSLAANETLQPCWVAVNTPLLLRHTLILCFHLYVCNAEISTSGHAVMISLCWGSWNVSRYIHDCVQVWLQQNIMLDCLWPHFIWKNWGTPYMTLFNAWSLHCLAACITASFPHFLCCALNWQMLATELSSRSRLLE